MCQNKLYGKTSRWTSRQPDFILHQKYICFLFFHHHCLVLTNKTKFKVIHIHFQVRMRTKEHGARRPHSACVYLSSPALCVISLLHKEIFLAFEWTIRANTLWLCLLHTKVRFTSSPRSFGISNQHAT